MSTVGNITLTANNTPSTGFAVQEGSVLIVVAGGGSSNFSAGGVTPQISIDKGVTYAPIKIDPTKLTDNLRLITDGSFTLVLPECLIRFVLDGAGATPNVKCMAAQVPTNK